MPYVVPAEEKAAKIAKRKLMADLSAHLQRHPHYKLAYQAPRYGVWVLEGADGFFGLRIWAYWSPSMIFRLSGACGWPLYGNEHKGYFSRKVMDNLAPERNRLEVSFKYESADIVLAWCVDNLALLTEYPDWLDPRYCHEEYLGKPLQNYLWEEAASKKYVLEYTQRKEEWEARLVRAAEVSQKGPGEHPAGFPVKARGL